MHKLNIIEPNPNLNQGLPIFLKILSSQFMTRVKYNDTKPQNIPSSIT